MKRWLKRTLFAVFGVALLGGALAAYAHREHGWHGGNVSAEEIAKWRGKLLDRAGRELQLDEAQKQRLGLLFDKVSEQRSALVAQGTEPRQALKNLIAGDRFDRAAANALVEEKTAAVRAKSPEVIAAAADFFDSLKPEQQAKVREFLDRRGHRHGGHGERG